MVKRLFLVSHAHSLLRCGLTADQRFEAKKTAGKIKSAMLQTEKITIWTSLCTEAIQTAELINQVVMAVDVVIYADLGFDIVDFDEDSVWLLRRINSELCDNLVLVCHTSHLALFRPILKSGRYRTDEMCLNDDDEFM